MIWSLLVVSFGFIGPRKEENPKDHHGGSGLQSPPAAAPESADVGTITLKSCCTSGIGPAYARQALGASDTQALT